MNVTVAIVGRPNVGKSTLFNRLVGKRLALVAAEPGLTRDRREGAARLFDLEFTAVDTAGLEEAEADSLEARMRAQTDRAVATADLALLLIDARAGITPLDRHFADWLRRGPTPVVLVANKCESRAGEAGRLEAFALGLGEPVPLSAEHNLGLSDLRDAIQDVLEGRALERDAQAAKQDGAEIDAAEEAGERALQLAIVGRPNVGKSTLVNRLVGEERVLTGPEAGITRDAIAIEWSYKGRPIRLIDTAGLRRRAKAVAKVEKLSAGDALRAIDFAQVVVLLVDAAAPMEKQDLTIARQVLDEGRALVIAVNKWDACADRAAAIKGLGARLERSLPQSRGLPVVTISALRGQNLDRLLDAVFAAYDVWNRRVATSALNSWLAGMVQRHPPPAPGGRRVRLRYATQAKIRPPSFVIFCSRPQAVPDSYLRYLENGLRGDFDLPGTPIRITLRKGKNPYADKG
ncbi:MAG: ribosome biogenesis GTPase Der [Proteobacteria bacterium]|nr:ribosome biogenesis GTPase Der [Pseudomonadota bacterium]